ncbi:phosphoribosylformylglycinamidine cyclo-ligase [Bacillus horti]|uniref:Phosphoribosylformylglycinamidine cyclo-ligase n=1 Tax=Caldalkalibacillus horti TaxID=77523 RepID=A0ABT9W1V2_9BACI|nr:phosphoribosylformylglycinamidine cyclo-ligase [Bacillus horti]MDQ0167219.1 phosphoribosylformylglycinamidine cyclo-ligase [Bacillus horti]
MSEAYKQAGVDIHAGYESVERIKKHVQKTMRSEVLSGIGGFGAMFELPVDRFKRPVLVSGTDGVGTKLKLAFTLDKHDTIGIDAVAMCVNDIVVQGAEPLYFLDYVACGKLDPAQVEGIVKGIADGCQEAGCALIGGETAEMPGFYPDKEYDVAGFTVGVVEKDKIISGQSIEPGDLLIGLPSSGIHSNGFSLVRKLLVDSGKFNLATPIKKLIETDEYGEVTLGDILLTPTRIYVKPILKLLEQFEVKGMAHITGGGFYENIPRMLPEQCEAEIDVGSWPIPAIFKLLQREGELSDQDMYNTFNMGVGFVIAVKNEDAIEVLNFLESIGEKAYLMGRIQQGSAGIHLAGLAYDEGKE